jgi:DNA-binding MarR family transcriptional regulator
MRTNTRHRPDPEPRLEARRLRGLLVDLMRRRSLRDPIAATCAQLDLSAAQVHVLLSLGHDGPLAMGEVARRVAVTEKTVTGLVDRLERDGLVRRARDETDRRMIRARLTPRGIVLSRRVDEEVLDKLTWLMTRLEAADRRHLFRIVEKLKGMVDET